MSSALFFAILGLVGLIGYLGIFVALHVLPTGYHPIRHAVSDYAVGQYGSLFRVGLLVSSLGVLFLAIGLTLDPGAPPLAVSQLVFLYLVPATRLGMALFRTDLEGEKLTRTGRLHYLFAIAAFAFTYAAISGMTPRLTSVSPWQSADGLLSALRWIALVSLVLLIVTLLPRLRTIFGLFERAFLVSTNLWFVTVGICLAIKAA
ncbi:DUF998 domain-containing protein [Streptomyces sp. NBC_00038]|uniref:DUF998 domain-containing protein n=1 Tax=Streptomyces sp. NBC_00038 TaxID=2903615 RepID=UPI002255CB56|nr:DUF998 domain-containing protein [Streptomyces sp. NBC_00038]MCX5562927.1 DUF998 domain-containing protein [Streptomyces sp. NBC_00038]